MRAKDVDTSPTTESTDLFVWLTARARCARLRHALMSKKAARKAAQILSADSKQHED